MCLVAHGSAWRDETLLVTSVLRELAFLAVNLCAFFFKHIALETLIRDYS